jgi:hypothetical protein
MRLSRAARQEVHMQSLELLIGRIRGEFREMPGLRLTIAQACRLWQVDPATCEAVLQTLLADHFLVRTANGSFMGLPTAQPTVMPLRVTMASSDTAAAQVRQRA